MDGHVLPTSNQKNTHGRTTSRASVSTHEYCQLTQVVKTEATPQLKAYMRGYGWVYLLAALLLRLLGRRDLRRIRLALLEPGDVRQLLLHLLPVVSPSRRSVGAGEGGTRRDGHRRFLAKILPRHFGKHNDNVYNNNINNKQQKTNIEQREHADRSNLAPSQGLSSCVVGRTRTAPELHPKRQHNHATAVDRQRYACTNSRQASTTTRRRHYSS